ncbi:MAG: prenyltransferase [Candidatus Eisenbacteria bacterium]|nr:prenyltransferase [Candidatus Eisenbacteria bacterium]
MIEDETAVEQVNGRLRAARGALSLAGARYWTASVMPALVGTTLPLWLRPPGFEFRWSGASEFLVATVLAHSGFSFFHACFARRGDGEWTPAGLSAAGSACLVLAGLLGWHLIRFVPSLIFIAYGLSVLLAGALYVAPPASFWRRPGGEIVLSMSLGLLPVLGAYLVQTGDLTRRVYLAALPVYTAMLLWVWTEEMAFRQAEGDVQRNSLIAAFGRRVSGRVIVPGISALLCATVVAAVLSSSVMPLALLALILVVPMWRVVALSRSAYNDAAAMLRARNVAVVVHSGLCAVLTATSILAAAY